MRKNRNLLSVGKELGMWSTAIALTMMATLAGCSATPPPPETAAQKQVLARFDINTCQQQGPGLYKCPAVDKPVCSPDYNGQLECVRIGKKGAVYLASPSDE